MTKRRAQPPPKSAALAVVNLGQQILFLTAGLAALGALAGKLTVTYAVACAGMAAIGWFVLSWAAPPKTRRRSR